MKFKDMPYTRVDKEEARKIFKSIIEEAKSAQSAEEQFAIHKKYYAIMDKIDSQKTLAIVRYYVDTTDEFYEKETEYYDEFIPEVDGLSVEYQKVLFDSPYRKEMEAIIGPVAFKNMEISFKAFDDKLIPLMQEENALVTKYDKLIASAKIEWEGDILNLSLMRPFLTNQDREVRKKAWEKYSVYFEENEKELDRIYDELVKNRTTQAKVMGYENYVELGYYKMNRNCYSKTEVETFRNQVKKTWVPFVAKLNEKRKQRLGLDQLSFIDEGVYFLNGNPKPTGNPEEIMAAGQKMYSELSEETKEFFDFMIENELFDVLGRKNKKAGGFMTYIREHRSPFIFANFCGTSSDVDVITHECGHAFQGYISGQDPIQEHADITMETAEVHSMSMEYFTEGWMDLFFGERSQDYLRMHLEDAAAFIPYGCMVDEFQHIVYEHPEMTPQERKKTWSQLEKEYKPHLDYGDNKYFGEGGFWQKQGHIYGTPFYYIDYCIAQSCAFQYKTWMDDDFKAAWDSYVKLCNLSASNFFTNMITEVGLKSPFEDGCIKSLVEKLEQQLKM